MKRELKCEFTMGRASEMALNGVWPDDVDERYKIIDHIVEERRDTWPYCNDADKIRGLKVDLMLSATGCETDLRDNIYYQYYNDKTI